MHRDVEEAELPERHEDADAGQDPPRHGRTAYQQDRGEDHDGEADRGEEQRRHTLHSPVDDHEVEPPDGGDEGGKEGVTGGHGPSLRPSIIKHQRIIQPLIM